MKNLLLSIIAFWGIIVLFSSSCKKPDAGKESSVNPLDTLTQFSGLVVPSSGSLEIELSNMFGLMPVTLTSQIYSTPAGDTFNIEDLRYYFTNFSLQRKSGEWINLKNYHLISHKDPASMKLRLVGVPAGHYSNIRVSLGVDSVANTSGLQEGALDPSWGMFWTWNTGYIFFRISGRNPSSGVSYSLDLGGNENLPEVTCSLENFKVKTTVAKLKLKVDMAEMFMNPFEYSFAKDGRAIHTNTAPGAFKLSSNMRDMVSILSLTE